MLRTFPSSLACQLTEPNRTQHLHPHLPVSFPRLFHPPLSVTGDQNISLHHPRKILVVFRVQTLGTVGTLVSLESEGFVVVAAVVVVSSVKVVLRLSVSPARLPIG